MNWQELKLISIILKVGIRVDLIIGVKHYPRTLKNIDARIADLDYMYRFLGVYKQPEVIKLRMSVNRALRRYDAYLDKLAWRLKRIELARNIKKREELKNGDRKL